MTRPHSDDHNLPDLPPFVGGILVLLSPQWQWIRQAFQAIHDDHETIYEAIGVLVGMLGGINVALDALKVEVAGIKSDVAELGEEVIGEIDDLAKAVAAGNTAEIGEATAGLVEARGRLRELITSLRGDNAPAPEPEPEPTPEPEPEP